MVVVPSLASAIAPCTSTAQQQPQYPPSCKPTVTPSSSSITSVHERSNPLPALIQNCHAQPLPAKHAQVAHELHLPVVVVPSLASTDAPCTALSVVYSDAGVVEEVVYFPTSPAMVVVDTTVIAEAPPVYLVAGMGDAMATWWVDRHSATATVALRQQQEQHVSQTSYC